MLTVFLMELPKMKLLPPANWSSCSCLAAIWHVAIDTFSVPQSLLTSVGHPEVCNPK